MTAIIAKQDKFAENGFHMITGTRYGLDGRDWFGNDKDGYDQNGMNDAGFDRAGYNHMTFTRFDQDGYDVNGYDEEGFKWNNFNKDSIHRLTGTKYDERGWTEDHINQWTDTTRDIRGLDYLGRSSYGITNIRELIRRAAINKSEQ